MPSYNNQIKYKPHIQEQGKRQTKMHSRSAFRSGWKASLRWAPFAKARARHT